MRDWGPSKATRERVEGVVVVLVLVFVPVFHGGYYVNLHFRHYHHHQLQRLPTIVRPPKLGGVRTDPDD